jgi:hypothetical protein
VDTFVNGINDSGVIVGAFSTGGVAPRGVSGAPPDAKLQNQEKRSASSEMNFSAELQKH